MNSAVASTNRHSIDLGGVTLDSPVLVAPMVGITDAPCRELCREFGAGVVFTEMVAAEAVVRSQEAAIKMLDFPSGVHPVGAQLVGCDPQIMAEAAQICVARGADIVDVNLGCPVRKVVNRGSGAGLAREIQKTAAVLEAMVNAVSVPVTAKMRAGWDHETINAPELSRALQDVGVRMVTVHGRTRAQSYRGFSDWDLIAKVKESVDIPVIGSGDVQDVHLVADRIRTGMVDGVVVARGMLGNFWFVRQAVTLVTRGEEIPDLEFADRIALARRHLQMLVNYHGERKALKIGRKYVAWTIKGCSGAARLRAMVQELDTLEKLEYIFEAALHAGLGPNGWFQPVFTSGEG